MKPFLPYATLAAIAAMTAFAGSPNPTPVQPDPAPVVTLATAGEGEAPAVVFDLPSEPETPAPPSKDAQPQPVAQVAHLPAAGGFCVDGSCSVAAPRRVVVERPQRSGLFRGRLFGRRR